MIRVRDVLRSNFVVCVVCLGCAMLVSARKRAVISSARTDCHDHKDEKEWT